jgi:dipeptidyl aminopeptidase/acylaminoacyl peptidase
MSNTEAVILLIVRTWYRAFCDTFGINPEPTMMSLDSISKSVYFRRIRPLCTVTIMAFSIQFLPPLSVAAQDVRDSPVTTPGLHSLSWARGDEPAVRYAISIPRNYSPSTTVPLILALHFGVAGGDAAGAGGDVVRILIGPALAELGAVIVAPDSVRGDWSSPENEKAVNALLDMVLARYSIDRKKVVVTGYSMGGAGSWHFAEKFPERFSAAIPVAGRPPASASAWRVPVLAIHSRDDQVVPFGPTEVRIAELQQAGVNAKLITLTGISHFETYRFRDALRQAVPWLREVWK